MGRLPTLLACSLAAASSTTAAQSTRQPFETLDLSLTLATDLNRGTLHRYWDPGVALAVGAALPFYLGTIETGVQYAHPQASRPDVPGFRSLFVYSEWRAGHALGRRLEVGAGMRVGVMLMRFDGDTLPAFRRTESELGIGTRATVRWTPRGPWFAETAIAYQSVLSHPRIEQVFLSGGVGRRFRTPRWLRDFLD